MLSFLYLILVVIFSEASPQPVLLVEDTDGDLTKGERLTSYLINSTLNVRLLDGRQCEEYSTHGSVLLSGVKILTEFLMKMPSQNVKEQFTIITTKCIRESLILRSIFNSAIPDKIRSLSLPILSLSGAVPFNADQGVLYLTPPDSILAETFYILCQSLAWSRIGLITSSSSSLHAARLTNSLQYSAKRWNITISFHLDDAHRKVVRSHSQDDNILKGMKNSGTKIVLVTMQSAQHVANILCTAHQSGMTWPEYGWVVLAQHILISDLIRWCNEEGFLEGVTFLVHHLNRDNSSGLMTYTNYQTDRKTVLEKIEENVKQGSEIIFDKYEYDSLFNQMKNGNMVAQALVKNGSLVMNNFMQLNKIPTSKLPLRVNSIYTYPALLSAVEITVCFLFISGVLLIFVCYRKEPEIRAASWFLSLLILLGCYMITLFLVLLTVVISSNQLHLDLCIPMAALSGTGLPQILILAVLLVKILRVYYIFRQHKKLGKISSDSAMLLFILLVLTPGIITQITSFWLKSNKRIQYEVIRNGYREVTNTCEGGGSLSYYIQVIYICLLMLCTGAVAWKTRNLRMRHFRDTKSVNAFLIVSAIIAVPTMLLYNVFTRNIDFQRRLVILHVSHFLYVIFCLGFLFVPKISAVMSRKLHSKKQLLTLSCM